MRKKVILRVTDENHVSQAGFVLVFNDQAHLDVALSQFLCKANKNAVLICEMITYDMFLNGVKLQKSK